VVVLAGLGHGTHIPFISVLFPDGTSLSADVWLLPPKPEIETI
jgi:hypothetical protein